MKNHKSKQFLWILYRGFVICALGYISILLGIFATDDPSTTIIAGIFTGIFIFTIGWTIFIWLPLRLFKWVFKIKQSKAHS